MNGLFEAWFGLRNREAKAIGVLLGLLTFMLVTGYVQDRRQQVTVVDPPEVPPHTVTP